MTDGDLPHHVMQNVPLEHLRDQSHALVHMKLGSIRSDDPRTFLASVLQRIKAIVRQFRGVGMSINAKHTAVMFRVVLHLTSNRRATFKSNNGNTS